MSKKVWIETHERLYSDQTIVVPFFFFALVGCLYPQVNNWTYVSNQFNTA